MKLKELCKKSHEIAKEKGWWDDTTIQEKILMTIVELSEAVQKDRAGDEAGFYEEIADVFIRLTDLTEYLGIDIEAEIERKMEMNKKREYKHGKKY